MTGPKNAENEAEVVRLAETVRFLEDRMDRIQNELPDSIRAAVALALQDRVPSDEEMVWVRLAIKKEAQSIRLREAIIEKTLTSLVWSALVGAALIGWTLIRTYLQTRGIKVE